MAPKKSRAKFTSQQVYLLPPSMADEVERIGVEDMDNSSKSAAARLIIGLGLARYAALKAEEAESAD